MANKAGTITLTEAQLEEMMSKAVADGVKAAMQKKPSKTAGIDERDNTLSTALAAHRGLAWDAAAGTYTPGTDGKGSLKYAVRVTITDKAGTQTVHDFAKNKFGANKGKGGIKVLRDTIQPLLTAGATLGSIVEIK